MNPGEPRRLFEDPTLGEALRRDLQVAAQDVVPPADVERAVAVFEASLAQLGGGEAALEAGANAAGAGEGAGLAGAGPAAAGAKVGGAAVVKWVAVVALTGSMGAGGALLLKRSGRQPVAPPVPAESRQAARDPVEVAPAEAPPKTTAPRARPEPRREAPGPRRAIVPRNVDSHRGAPPARSGIGRAVAPAQERAPVAPPPEAPTSRRAADDVIGPEVALLARIRRELGEAPARALASVDEARRRFPHGVLSEEREALGVFALERLGRRADAAARGRVFLEKFPGGPFSERIRRIVADGSSAR